MKSISNMFKELGINTYVNYKKGDDEDRYIVFLNFECSINNISKYADFIGYRYCYQKQRKIAIVIEYCKCKNEIKMSSLSFFFGN